MSAPLTTRGASRACGTSTKTHAASCARNERARVTGCRVSPKVPSIQTSQDPAPRDARYQDADAEARSTQGAWRTVDHSSAPPPSSERPTSASSSHRAENPQAVLPVARVALPGLTFPPSVPSLFALAACSLWRRRGRRRLACRRPRYPIEDPRELKGVWIAGTSFSVPRGVHPTGCQSRTETCVPRRRTILDATERRGPEMDSYILLAVTGFRTGSHLFMPRDAH